jgi:adenylate cyclase
VLVLWLHGCIGIRAWLRSKRWYPHASGALAALATLLPVLALLGFTNAGFNIREIAENDPASAAKYLVGQPGTEAAENYAATVRLVNGTWLAYLGLLVASTASLTQITSSSSGIETAIVTIAGKAESGRASGRERV